MPRRISTIYARSEPFFSKVFLIFHFWTFFFVHFYKFKKTFEKNVSERAFRR